MTLRIVPTKHWPPVFTLGIISHSREYKMAQSDGCWTTWKNNWSRESPKTVHRVNPFGRNKNIYTENMVRTGPTVYPTGIQNKYKTDYNWEQRYKSRNTWTTKKKHGDFSMGIRPDHKTRNDRIRNRWNNHIKNFIAIHYCFLKIFHTFTAKLP